jgi:hypothetical protein
LRATLRPPWRRGKTSLQASWLILNERNMQQSRAAKSRPQLEALLQRLLIVFLRSIFHNYGVALLTLVFPFPSSGISTSQGGDTGSETNFTTLSCKKNPG